MKISHLVYAPFFLIIACAQSQENDPMKQSQSEEEIVPLVANTHTNSSFYDKTPIPSTQFEGMPKNIILMVGDGMGTSQVYAGMVANKGNLNLQHATHSGFSKTNSSDDLITDSAAGATAFACGIKTYNGAIGVDDQGNPVKTIMEMAEEKNLSTGLVATCRINHATPASFISHQPQRSMYEEIAADFLNVDFEVIIGGGRKWFNQREDGRNLLNELAANGYTIASNLDSITVSEGDKLVALLEDEDMPKMTEGRGNMLPRSSKLAVDILSQNPNGFFLMIEGSQIDWGGHANDTEYIVQEMLDFDRAVGEVFKFAFENKETLVIITADHETGGFAINGGNESTGTVEGAFTTGSHTGVLVPVFAYGPGSEEFSGMYENTEIYEKMVSLYGWGSKESTVR